MAILNLMDLQPTVISRDLRDKYILLYGLPSFGLLRSNPYQNWTKNGKAEMLIRAEVPM